MTRPKDPAWDLGAILEDHRAAQLDLWTRRQARAAGYSKARIDGRVRSGRWIVVFRGVLALPGTPLDHDHLLLAACLARPSAVASHESAAWLWGLLEGPPSRPTVSVPRTASHGPLGPVKVRTAIDLPTTHIVGHRHTRCTDPLRTLVDLAGVVDAATLDAAVDRALPHRLVTVAGLEAEIGRIRRRGRRGVGILEQSLRRRGMIGVVPPSVLESKLARLLHGAGIDPAGMEVTVVGEGGAYRLDTLLAPGVAVEVDGFAYHNSPEDRARDLRRHNDLTRRGLWVVRFSWHDVVRRPGAVIAEIQRTLTARQSLDAGPRSPSGQGSPSDQGSPSGQGSPSARREA